MIGSVMAALAEFERDLIRERIKSGIAAAKARGKRLGRQPGQRPSDRKAKKVLKLAEAGLSYRLIGRHVGLSKNTVGAILQRARAANQSSKCNRPEDSDTLSDSTRAAYPLPVAHKPSLD